MNMVFLLLHMTAILKTQEDLHIKEKSITAAILSVTVVLLDHENVCLDTIIVIVSDIQAEILVKIWVGYLNGGDIEIPRRLSSLRSGSYQKCKA